MLIMQYFWTWKSEPGVKQSVLSYRVSHLRFPVLENAGARPDVVDPTQFSGDERRSQDLNNVKLLNTILAASPTESEGFQTYLGECGVCDLQTEAVQDSV